MSALLGDLVWFSLFFWRFSAIAQRRARHSGGNTTGEAPWEEAHQREGKCAEQPPSVCGGGKASSARAVAKQGPGKGAVRAVGAAFSHKEVPWVWAQGQALLPSHSRGDGEGERKVCGRTQVIHRTQGQHPLSELSNGRYGEGRALVGPP